MSWASLAATRWRGDAQRTPGPERARLAVARSLVLGLGAGLVAALSLASPAAAGDAVLWVCHGPAGQPLGTAGVVPATLADGANTTFGSGCSSTASQLSDGGLRAGFARPDPVGASSASWRIPVPVNTQLGAVRITRRTTGFSGAPDAGNPQRYTARTSSTVLESAALDDATGVTLDGQLAVDPALGDVVQVGVSCGLEPNVRCPAPAGGTVGVEFGSMALTVRDDDAPHAAVGGLQSPAAGILQLGVHATDSGLGLWSTSATLDGAPVATRSLGGPGCFDLSPDDPTIDLPVGGACPPVVGNATLLVDTLAVADGEHQLKVTVTDAAGNVAKVVDQSFTVLNHPPQVTPSVTLAIGNNTPGTGNPTGGPADGSGNPTGNHGLACVAPRLSMFLAQRPLRISRGTAVLLARRRYRFAGQLTCRVGGRRKPAPRTLVVQILNRVKGHTLLKSGTTVRANGAVTVILAYKTSRTIIFRYTIDGVKSQVSIRVRVAQRRR